MQANKEDELNVINVPSQDVGLLKRLSKIKHKIVVMSGKGGVGKSTVATNLAVGLAMMGYETGLLDADIHGPDIAKMLHIEDAQLEADDNGIIPIFVPPRLKVMSMAFLSPDRDQPIVWRGPLKMGAIRKFIEDVLWGDLDYLIIDLPPGTGDEPLTVAQLIKDADGSIIVTTPQDVALLDSRKTVKFSEGLKLPVIGIVENMAGLICPHCKKEVDLFKKGGGEKAAQDLKVDFLGRVPIDPEVVESGDEGIPIVARNPDSPAAVAFKDILEKVIQKTSKKTKKSADIAVTSDK